MLALCCLLAGCGSYKGAETPEEAATYFLEAVRSGSQSRIYEAVVRSEGESFQHVDEKLNHNRWKDNNLEEFEVGEVELAGNRAIVKVMTTREIDDEEVQQEELVVCVQEHGKWKVTMSASSKLFLPSAKRPD